MSGASPAASLPTRAEAPGGAPFDRRRLSYASTFDDPWRSGAIRAIEWGTGKARLLRLVRRFEARGIPHGHPFWAAALAVMEIEVRTPAREVARIPADGPVVVVANHPHGLVDGMVMAELVGRVRADYRILTRSLLTGIDEVARFLIPVPFPHEPDALQASLAMRRAAMEHLEEGGCVALFPSGAVASSDRIWGPAVEREWSPFTAKLILRSGATVVPMRFKGANGRAYQIASRVSPTLRQGLLIREVVRAAGRPQRPVVGPPIPADALVRRGGSPREMMARLRGLTLALE